MKQILLCLTAVLAFAVADAQSTYIPLGSEGQHVVDRMEVKSGYLTEDVFTAVKPFSRKHMVTFLERINFAEGETRLGALDRSDMYYLFKDNREWTELGDIESKKPILKYFYKYPADFYSVDTDDFILRVNPVLNLTAMYESNPNAEENLKFINTRGLEIRGRIADKIGFYTSILENQAKLPYHVRQFTAEREAVPGEGRYKDYRDIGVDYLGGSGYVTFNATEYVDVQFGYGKNFIGNGYRSMMLSDFSNNYTFLKLNTKIWKFNYQNIFAQLVAPHERGSDRLLPKKYAAFHHLSLNLTKWLNVGVFEAVMFGREDGVFELQYLNPIIFYRTVESHLGSPDNVLLGVDFKANIARRASFYGQLMLDDYKFFDLVKFNGLWNNKLAYQAGIKLFDLAPSIGHLDLQLEYNAARPYTYDHIGTQLNYSHYNQPLAHPLGANFREFVGIVRLQPKKNLWFKLTGSFAQHGADATDSLNWGGDIFKPYFDQDANAFLYEREFDNVIGQGVKQEIINAELLATYMIKHNLFVDAHYNYRSIGTSDNSEAHASHMIGMSLRWNAWRKSFDF